MSERSNSIRLSRDPADGSGHTTVIDPQNGSADHRGTARAWWVLLLGLLAYIVAVWNRTSLGVAAVEAQERLGASASQLALFSVVQVGTYAALQVPVGVLLERFGSRRIITGGVFLMALGQVAMATVHLIPLAVVARLLVGAGDAAIFVSVVRAAAGWFAPRHMPLLTQLIAIVGQGGQLVASLPMIILLHTVGWTGAFLVIAGISGLATIAVFAGIREAPRQVASTDKLEWTAVGNVVRGAWRAEATRLGFWCHFTVQFPGMLFVLLWGYPYLVEAEEVGPYTAGTLISLMVPSGIAIGLVLGRLSGQWPACRMRLVLACVGLTSGTWATVLLWPGPAPIWLLTVLAIVLASNVPASMLGIDIARSGGPSRRLGISVALCNAGGFAACLIAMGCIGIAIDLSEAFGGSPRLSFRLGMATQLLVTVLGVILIGRARSFYVVARPAPMIPLPCRRRNSRRSTEEF